MKFNHKEARKNRVIYVISPYRSDDPAVVAKRVYECERYCAHLFNEGFFPICTTSEGHHWVEQFQVTDDFEIWRENCLTFIDICGEVHILMQDGWQQSSGLADEIAYCEEVKKPHRYIYPAKMDLYIRSDVHHA